MINLNDFVRLLATQCTSIISFSLTLHDETWNIGPAFESHLSKLISGNKVTNFQFNVARLLREFHPLVSLTSSMQKLEITSHEESHEDVEEVSSLI